MSIKNFSLYSFVCLFLLVFFPCCSKRYGDDLVLVDGSGNNKKLGIDYYKMSILELEEGAGNERNCRKALYYLNKALAQGETPHYLAQKATLLFLLGNGDESLKCFEHALKLSMTENVRTEILNNYACVLAKKGDRKRAMELLESLEKNKNYLTPEVALVNQARLYYEDKKFDLAKQKLKKAVHFAPDYVDAHYYLGLIAYMNTDYRTSLQALNKTVQLEPKHEGALLLREKCCEKLMIC